MNYYVAALNIRTGQQDKDGPHTKEEAEKRLPAYYHLPHYKNVRILEEESPAVNTCVWSRDKFGGPWVMYGPMTNTQAESKQEDLMALGYHEIHIGSEPPKYVDPLSKDAPTIVNEHGGKQSHLPYRCDLLPPDALLTVANVLDQGAKKYGDSNWRKIEVRDHLNHALTHIYAYLKGDTQDDHLSHAATRLLFALDTKIVGVQS